VIEGLKLDVPADELARRLSELIAWHESRAGGCDDRLRRLAAIQAEVRNIDEHLDGLGWEGGFERLSGALERTRAHHRERAWVLVFLRDHLVSAEVYRLDVEDLRLTGLIPRELSERPAVHAPPNRRTHASRSSP
jgi:hypothetical protein